MGTAKNVKEHCQWKLYRLNKSTMTLMISHEVSLPTLPHVPQSQYMFAHGFCAVAVTGAAQPQPLSAGRKWGVAIAE